MLFTIGVTGGIGSGKSKVCERMQKDFNIRTIDADNISHMVMDSDDSVRHLSNILGNQILNETGNKIDRSKLGKLVFDDAVAMEILEAYMHPKIKQHICGMIKNAAQLSNMRDTGGLETQEVFVIEAPLLFECKLEDLFEAIIVVNAPLETRIERIIQRNGCSREDAEKRIAKQMPLDEKIALADEVIENSEDGNQFIQKQLSNIFEMDEFGNSRYTGKYRGNK